MNSSFANQPPQSSLFGSGMSVNGISASQQPLTHSQSAYNLNVNGNGNGAALVAQRRIQNTPSWAATPERRTIPSHLSSSKRQNRLHLPGTPDRSNLAGSNSFDKSPPRTGFGASSFGTPKPTKKKLSVFDQDDLPPTESIYDLGPSPFSVKKDHGTPNGNLSRTTTMNSFAMSRLGTPQSKRQSLTNNTLGTPNLRSSNLNTVVNASSSSSTSPEDENAVVVFGYSENMSSVILNHFSRFGTILENLQPANVDSPASPSKSPIKTTKNKTVPLLMGKTWIKLTYDNPSSALRAENENGTVIAGQIIGCVRYSQEIIEKLKSEVTIDDSSSLNYSCVIDSPISKLSKLYNSNEPYFFYDNSDINEISNSNSNSNSNSRLLNHTISMPIINQKSSYSNSNGHTQILSMKDGRGIFKDKDKSLRITALSNSQNKNNSNSLNNDNSNDWLQWISKKAQNLVFGWDDL